MFIEVVDLLIPFAPAAKCMVRCIHLLVDCAPLERQTAITAKSINIRLLWSQDIDSLRPSAVNNCVDSTRTDIILCDYLVRL